eukprot:SAG22_NODE_87_length_21437_cov_14.162480_14_plen_930_part_00
MPPAITLEAAALRVNCHSAVNLPKMDAGFQGSCDPFITVQVGGQRLYRTKIITSNRNPVWNEQLVVPVMVPQAGPGTSDQVRIGVWDDDLTSKEPIGFCDVRMSMVERCWEKPAWVHIYGAPKELSVSASISKSISFGLAEDQREKHLANMNYGLEEGTAYRGSVLLSLKVDRNADDVVAAHKGMISIDRVPDESVPKITYKCCVMVLQGNALPGNVGLSGKMLGDSKVSVEVCIGDQVSKSKDSQSSIRGATAETSKKECIKGQALWYEVIQMDVEYPPDFSQVPDIFINLKVGDKRVSYRRFNMCHRSAELQIHHSMDKMDAGDMSAGGSYPGKGCRWINMKRDMTAPTQYDKCFPGSLLINIVCEPQLPPGMVLRDLHQRPVNVGGQQQRVDTTDSDDDEGDDYLSDSDGGESEGRDRQLGRDRTVSLSPLEIDELRANAEKINDEKDLLIKELAAATKRGERTLLVHLSTIMKLKDKELFGKMDPYVVVILGTAEVKDPTKDPYPYKLNGARQACRSKCVEQGGTDITLNDSIKLVWDPSLTHLVLQVWSQEDSRAMKAAAQSRQENMQNPAGYNHQWPSRKDTFIGQMFIKLDEIPGALTKGARGASTNLSSSTRNQKEPVEIVDAELWGVHSKPDSKPHGRLNCQLFYFGGDEKAREEAEDISARLDEKYNELQQANLEVSDAAKQISKTMIKYTVDKVAPLRKEFDVDSKLIQEIPVGTELTCHAIQTDEQTFRHIKTVSPEGKTGWVPIRGSKNEVLLRKVNRAKAVSNFMGIAKDSGKVKTLADDHVIRAEMRPPQTEGWELRLHIYQCKDLPAADDDGTSDPYLKVTVAGQTQFTRVVPDTCYPRFYQTLTFRNLQLPDENYVRMGLAPRIVLQVYDSDQTWYSKKETENADDFLGRATVPLNDPDVVSFFQLKKSPQW